MNKAVGSERRVSDYSLVGADSARAVELGLAEAVWYTSPVSKEQMRRLLQRRDGPALRDTLLWFALLAFFGAAGYWLWGSWWAIFPFAIYGVLYASVSDSRWHESLHGTAFKTDWMNNALYELASFMVLRESVRWRWSHTRHHSDTLVVGRDPEVAVPRPPNLLRVIGGFFNLKAFPAYAGGLFRHSLGRLEPQEMTYIPESEYGKLFWRARLYLLIYAAVIGLALYTRSLLPLMYVGLVNVYGAWLMVVYGLTQHAAMAENVLDHRLNCRTVYMNRLNRYLYWNMNYHVEHHMFPLVPYHALPALHALVKPDMPTPYASIVDAYREIVPALLRQARDPSFFIKRRLPPPQARPAAADASGRLRLDGRSVMDGWIELCDSARLEKEDVLRFDRDGKTYAAYRAADGRVYASDGLCTHGNAHLADGMVKGTLIECAKHNGRFDVRDGSPQRLPVCVGLKTYPVRERAGALQVNLEQAGGYGVEHAAAGYTLRVVSNRNVATFIKELVLEPVSGTALPEYRPGDYLQLDIPAYPERTLRDVVVDERYLPEWQAGGLFDLRAANPVPARRNYSLATNPTVDRDLRFNVRLATPPRGVDCPAGSGSAYVFGLRPGDIVTAGGPFGEFHVRPGEQEKIYLGGGAGMAPLRAHLSSLLETQRTQARVSYWYGARSLQEAFYLEYFERLAQQHANFSFHLALSEPRPEDAWQGLRGFIHAALLDAYLAQHPDPAAVDYYLCGPPAMIQAASVMLKNLGVPAAQIAYDEY